VTLRHFAAATALLIGACSGGDTGSDVPPLPEQTAESGNAVMAEAEKAASDAAQRSATSADQARSPSKSSNEVTP
jgi:hypothetical protein